MAADYSDPLVASLAPAQPPAASLPQVAAFVCTQRVSLLGWIQKKIKLSQVPLTTNTRCGAPERIPSKTVVRGLQQLCISFQGNLGAMEV